MKVSRVKEILKAKELVSNSENPDPDINATGGSDLMSDVLAFAKPGALLLTGLTNPQTIRTAEMMDLRAVCYVRGKQPPPETLELAKEKNIVVLATDLKLFEACGKLYTAGMPPIKD